MLKRADFLEQLLAGKQPIAIAGTHGKTTTTAMLAWVLTALGADPSYVIGGVAVNLAGMPMQVRVSFLSSKRMSMTGCSLASGLMSPW